MASNSTTLHASTTKHATETRKITVRFNGHGYVFEYKGKTCTSAEKLLSHLDKRKKYRLFFHDLVTDEIMLEQVEALEAAGISIDSVESGNNRDASTEVISVSKLKKRAK